MTPKLARLLILPLVAALLALAGPAAAQSLDEAKAAGLVGERADGLLGAVKSEIPAPVKALVDQVNTRRLAEYGDIARRNKLTVEQVQAIAGAKLVRDAPSGTYVMDDSGAWRAK